MTSIDLINRFYIEERFLDIAEIIREEAELKYFKSMYVKHAFDDMGGFFKETYNMHFEHVKKIKLEYKEKYDTRTN